MDRLYLLTVTTPANTTALGELLTDWPLEDSKLGTVQIITPDGHNGLTGIRIIKSGQQIIPWGADSHLVMNAEDLTIPFNDEMQSTGLVIGTYNTDVFDHTHYLRAVITDLPEPGAPVQQPLTLIPLQSLQSSDTTLGSNPNVGN